MENQVVINTITNRGINCPISARTFVQGREILKLCFFIEKDKKEKILKSIINLSKKLSACADHFDNLNFKINEAIKVLEQNKFKQIDDLNKISEHFIDEAYLASKDIVELIRHFFNCNIASLKYDKVITWAKENGYIELSQIIEQSNEKFLKKISDLRTERHHPENSDYNFSIVNIQKNKQGIVLPLWRTSKHLHCYIHEEMQLFISGLLELQEFILILGSKKINPQIGFEEIPLKKRNQNCPLRFNLFFAGLQIRSFAVDL